MNNKKPTIDSYTKELISKTKCEDPGKDFTKRVMNQILKDPSVKVNFITRDDKNSSLWLVLSIAGMIIAYSVFIFIKTNFSLTEGIKNIQTPSYINLLTEFFSKFWNELSLSPYILFALPGILILVILDKVIVRYLYSI